MENQAPHEVDDLLMSPDIGKLAEALAKAQSEMSAAKKDAKNPFFKSDYATLLSCLAAGNPHLNKHGLCVTQLPVPGNGEVSLVTMLMHTSGQWIKSTLSVKPQKTDPQALGSCISYLRRYSYSAIIGQATADDDDAESAMVREPKKAPQPAKVKPKEESKFTVTMRGYYKQIGEKDFMDCLKSEGIGSLQAMSKIKDPVIQKKLSDAMSFLVEKKAA